MRLGGFWGLTAPMLLLASPPEGMLIENFKLFNTSMNRSILKDLKVELIVLSRLMDISIVSTGLKEQEMILKKYSKSAFIKKGNLLIEDFHDELLQCQLEYEIAVLLAEMIIKGEKSGNRVSLQGDLEGINKCVSNWIQTQTLSVADLRPAIRKLYRSLCVNSGPSITLNLLRSFKFSLQMPERLLLDGERVEVSENVQKIGNFYLGKLDDVHRIYNLIDIAAIHEDVVFNASFFDVIRRKPESILYGVISKFDFVKTKQTANVMYNLIHEIRSDIEAYRNCLQKYVYTADSKVSYAMLTESAYQECLQNFNESKATFFEELESTGALCITDLSLGDFEILSGVYDCISKLALGYLNQCFELGCSTAEMQGLSKELCNFGIYGININSMDLLKDAICNTSLVTRNRIVKSREDLTAIQDVLNLIDDLLDTLIPIGEEINV